MTPEERASWVHFQPWINRERWAAYLDAATDERTRVDVDPDAVLVLTEEMRIQHRFRHLALAVAGEEPSLSRTVAAATRAYWREIKTTGRGYPVWWTAPAGLALDQVSRALAEHLGSPVAAGHNPNSWVRDLVVGQAVPILVLGGLGNLAAHTADASLPRLLAYLVKNTRTLFVFVEPEPERPLFDAPAGHELSRRTALITLGRPRLARVLPFPGRR